MQTQLESAECVRFDRYLQVGYSLALSHLTSRSIFMKHKSIGVGAHVSSIEPRFEARSPASQLSWLAGERASKRGSMLLTCAPTPMDLCFIKMERLVRCDSASEYPTWR